MRDEQRREKHNKSKQTLYRRRKLVAQMQGGVPARADLAAGVVAAAAGPIMVD